MFRFNLSVTENFSRSTRPNPLRVILASAGEMLPCMREPTVAPLHGNAGFAVKAAVPRADLPRLIPEIKARGGTDIVVTELAQIVQ